MMILSPPPLNIYGYLRLREDWLPFTIQHNYYKCRCIDITLAGLQANFIMRPGTRSDPSGRASLRYSFRLA